MYWHYTLLLYPSLSDLPQHLLLDSLFFLHVGTTTVRIPLEGSEQVFRLQISVTSDDRSDYSVLFRSIFCFFVLYRSDVLFQLMKYYKEKYLEEGQERRETTKSWCTCKGSVSIWWLSLFISSIFVLVVWLTQLAWTGIYLLLVATNVISSGHWYRKQRKKWLQH